MIIGTVRPKEARVFDSAAGYHNFHNEDGTTYGSFEVFWHNGGRLEALAGEEEDEQGASQQPGWYWWACLPGCLPEGDPIGPFASSTRAMYDADEYHPDNMPADDGAQSVTTHENSTDNREE